MVTIILPMLLLVFIALDDSSEQDALTTNTAADIMITDALYLAMEYGGNWIDYIVAEYILNGFNYEEMSKSNFREIKERIENESIEDILGENYKMFAEIKEHFYAIYGGIAQIEEREYTYKNEEGEKITETFLEIESKIYHPYPAGIDYTHYNDYGADRSFGGERSHQGNDMMAQRGTPIIAVASGYIEHIGWNTLGGQIIGIRDEHNRYWYYAHMEKYESGMKKGKTIEAGDIIGYVGDTGYGPPGTKGKFGTHLHIQLGIMFPNEKEMIYINPYGIIKFSEMNKIDLREDEEDENREDDSIELY